MNKKPSYKKFEVSYINKKNKELCKLFWSLKDARKFINNTDLVDREYTIHKRFKMTGYEYTQID